MHPVETYGLVFRSQGHVFSFITDTRYFDDIIKSYSASELLIINMVFTEPRPPVEHLAIPDAARIIAGIKPKAAILSHFGMHVWQAKPWKIAEELSQQTGVRVIAARDGMVFDIAELDGD